MGVKEERRAIYEAIKSVRGPKKKKKKKKKSQGVMPDGVISFNEECNILLLTFILFLMDSLLTTAYTIMSYFNDFK